MSRGSEQDGTGSAILRRLILLVLLGLMLSPASSQTPAPAARPRGGQEATARRKEPPMPPMSEEEIREARALLTERGYWVLTEVTGLDASLRHALIAYQKIEGRARTGILTREELEALRAAGTPAPLESGYAHVEVDLKRQVLFFVPESGTPARILPISSGSGEWFTEGGHTRRAITPTGRFKIVRKIEGWRKSPLGLLHYPNYIYDGIAIHGNPAVPPTPASHGCIRIPMFASKEFSALAVIGLPVIVYDAENSVRPAPAPSSFQRLTAPARE